MGFIKEFRDFDEEMPEWEYLNSIGVRTLFGHELRKHVFNLVLDKENNYYLITQGHTGRSHTEEDIFFYILCLDGKKVQIEATETFKKNPDKTVDTLFEVRKIEVIDKELLQTYSEERILELVKEALTARAKIKEEDYSLNGKVTVKDET